MERRVQGYCPMGCGETLFLDEGGHVICSRLECLRPTAVDELLDQSTSPDQAIVEAVADDDLEWARALETAAEIRQADRAARDAYIDAFDQKWLSWHVADEPDNKIPRPSDWRQSVENFYNAGLPEAELIHLVDVAMNAPHVYLSKTFRYFCGCCWNAIKDLQQAARDLLEHDKAEGG